MKAIEILFNKIDELNTQIKDTNDMNEKICAATKMMDIIKIINQIGTYHFDREETTWL